MKHILFNYSDKKEFKQAYKEVKKSIYKSLLIQLYATNASTAKIQKVINLLSEKFPKAIIIGATSSGNIKNAIMQENGILVSLSIFKHTKLKVGYSKNTDKKSGEKLAKKLFTKNTKATIVLSEGLLGEDYSGFINALSKISGKNIIAGGLAGDNLRMKESLIFLNKTIYKEGSIVISLSHKNLYADNRYNLNWKTVGNSFVLTKVRDKTLYEINGINAVEYFTSYIGKAIFENNNFRLPTVQLLFEDGFTNVARTPVSSDGKSILFASELKEGLVVKFGFANPSSIAESSKTISNIISKKPAEAIYVYSCIARKCLLGSELEVEFQSYENLAPSGGFFTQGEYYSSFNTPTNILLNCSTTILVLSENNKVKKYDIAKKGSESIESFTFKALNHFIKQTTSELRNNITILNQYKELMDKTLLISKVDMNFKITYANDNLCKVSQYDRSELIGSDSSMLFETKNTPELTKNMITKLKNGEPWDGILENIAKDGTTYFTITSAMPIKNTLGEVLEYIVMRIDISKQIQTTIKLRKKERKLKSLLQKSKQAQEAKSMFLAKMSHEIRTPLNGILGFTKALTEMKLDSTSAEYVDIIDKSGESLLSIVNDILDISKVEQGKTTLVKINIDLANELKTAINIYNEQAKIKNINYLINIDENISTRIICDSQKICQALSNIISNAIKFTPENGTIDVNISLLSSEENSNKVSFKIKDSGIGIPANRINDIFNSFTQADNSVQRAYGGTGLGLSISSKFINMMGSYIDVQSQVGVGTTFSFTLELQTSSAVCIEEKSHLIGETVIYDNISILVAEDNLVNQKLIDMTLKKRGIIPKIVNNGLEVLSVAEQEVFDIILMDINMPLMDGIEATKILREKEYSGIIISVSADVIKSNVEKFLAVGINDTISKPLDIGKLDIILDRYVSNKYDIIDLDKLKIDTGFEDENDVAELYQLFKNASSQIIEEFRSDGLKYDSVHTLKGMCANLRFHKLFAILKDFELNEDTFSDYKKEDIRKIITLHVENIVKQIEGL